jgi:hypothetical protein
MKPIHRIIFLLPVLFILFCPPLVMADEEPEVNIADILITTSKTHLLLFCTIKDSFTPEMIQGVRNGIPIIFDFSLELEKINNTWLDTTLAEFTLQHTMTYDQVREEYQVTLQERGGKTIATDSIDKAMELMSELNGVKIIERSALVPDAPYALRVKAKLVEKTLPLNMHYIIPFISLWDFETDWRTIEFRY